MPALKNDRRELFCQYLLQGKAAAGAEGAYVLAGFKRNDQNASRLRRESAVAERLRELREALAGTTLVNVESLSLELDEARMIAIQDRNPAAAVAAINAKAKLHGLDVSHVKHDHTHRYEQMTNEELEYTLTSFLTEIREANGLPTLEAIPQPAPKTAH